MLSWLFRRWKAIRLYHKYYRRTGLYKFLFHNTFKLIAIILLILIIFFFIERYIIDFDVVFNDLDTQLVNGTIGALRLLNHVQDSFKLLSGERCCGRDLLLIGDLEGFLNE